MTPRPSPSALEAARELLHSLASARQSYGLYEAGHPIRTEGATEVLRRIRDLERAMGDPVLFVTRHGFYLGSALLARESLSLYRLLEAFETAGAEAVEILPGVGEHDVDALIRLLLGDPGARGELRGIAVNRVKPSVGDEEEYELTELRRDYALGLDLIRETAARLAAGRAVDLGETTRFVNGLAEKVVEDPTQALLLTAIKSYDEYTYYHMVNVCLLSVALGLTVGLRHDQVVALGVGALLHDVGKVNVPRDVLLEPGPLTEEQWRLMQRHPVEGAGIVFATGEGLFHPAATVVLEHHAAFDLSGYPSLSGRAHPSVPARMVAVADCFDALTSDRPYRKAEERRQALSIIRSAAGNGYDPRVVRVFVRMLGLFPVGSLVRLSTGAVGMVVRNHEELPACPVVRLVLDPRGEPCPPQVLDLSDTGPDGEFLWSVERAVDPRELGVDLTAMLMTGQLESPPEGGEEPGLLHEPAFGEAPPPGYVDTHNHGRLVG